MKLVESWSRKWLVINFSVVIVMFAASTISIKHLFVNSSESVE